MHLSVNRGQVNPQYLTLLSALILLAAARFLVDGTPIEQLDLHSYRRFISVVPQNTVLFSGTIKRKILHTAEMISVTKSLSMLSIWQSSEVLLIRCPMDSIQE